MGADGGVEWILLKDPNKYDLLWQLILPFWQIGWRGNKSGCAGYNCDKHYEWMGANPTISPPRCLIGFYGTDRGDHCGMEDLVGMLECDEEPYFDLTFRELDIYFRTQGDLDSWLWRRTPWHAFWMQHFQYNESNAVCEILGSLRQMRVSDWIEEMRSLLHLTVCSEETWT